MDDHHDTGIRALCHCPARYPLLRRAAAGLSHGARPVKCGRGASFSPAVAIGMLEHIASRHELGAIPASITNSTCLLDTVALPPFPIR
jgi:hypothetical protein